MAGASDDDAAHVRAVFASGKYFLTKARIGLEDFHGSDRAAYDAQRLPRGELGSLPPKIKGCAS